MESKIETTVLSEIPGGNNYAEVVSHLRKTFDSGITLDLEFRKKQLKNLIRMFEERKDEILAAQEQDIRRNFFWGEVAEIETVKLEANSQLRHLKEYAGKEKLPFHIATALDDAYVRKEPFGVVLIIGTWNLPFQTCCQAFAGAIAAGNCVIIKPSEISPHCAQTIATLIPKYLDQNCYQVITGDGEASKQLLQHKFDHIFFTGSQAVAKCILQAAAPNLTPVTLELGGINPCFIDASADYQGATKKTIWGKLVNGGQLCVAPGYVMCSEQIQDFFVRHAKVVLKEFYGNNLRKSPDLPRIINKHHFNRIKSLLEATKGKIVIGGEMDENDLWIEPTVVVNVDPEDSLMREEIFGPILPIIVVSSLDEAIRIIRSKPKPLASYIFSNDQKVNQKYIESTSCGSTCINDIMWQAFRPGLPFGGVGESGMGSYHGKATFETFSHKRSVLEVSQDIFTNQVYSIRFPPHTHFKAGVLTFLGVNYERMIIPFGTIFSHVLAGIVALVFYMLLNM
ncbi:unnamed protein product [Allacma fusca]|uniref:Aldehyde dehydrogenase n=1 Tax=Allacma fusca TaxID=39272 RepID=A0A8J2LA82_9HEXA|nr:unnamed protein product [Allacma fusca]